ncbi:MAG: zinc metallopeptidase [Paludibacteraceae bacterium]|nr:zinc metallopeptidase [Paludibacteraceae bacterium]
MRLDGRRESTNVDDRRGMSGGRKAGFAGIGGIIIVAIITLLTGGDLSSLVQQAQQMSGSGTSESYQPTAEEEELATFCKQILASTEDVWTQEFHKIGKTYKSPTLVLFTGSVSTGCGNGSASTGPFYCSADQCLYIDLSFFEQMKSWRKSKGDMDFAYAYVIAHEVGHHVQYLLGTLSAAHQKMARLSQTEANKVSVRIELQADFYAGVWGYYEGKLYNSLEDGDLEEALNCAQDIGDDYLQKQAYGTTQPETFNHGTSAQRLRWLRLGLTTGDMTLGDTFSKSDAQL